MSDKIVFKVNGHECHVGSEVTSDVMLLDYIRNTLELRGTKYMCREAGCGACVVTAKRPSQKPYSINSCMVPVTACHGLEITTIEGIGNKKKGYHVVQTTLAENNGTQCGYCSPGFVMSMYSLLQYKPDYTMLEIENALSSNVCRCTGFRPILEAFKKFAKDAPKEDKIMDIEDLKICKMSNDTCKENCTGHEDGWCLVNKFELLLNKKMRLELKDGKIWYRVDTIKEICDIWNDEGTDCYMLIAGDTAKGAYPIFEYPEILIDINNVTDIKGYSIDQNLIIGGGVTLTQLLEILKKEAETEYFWYLQKLYDHVLKVAHVPVRNIGTIAGNLMIKHQHPDFPSDIYLLFETVGAQLTIAECDRVTQTVTMQQFLALDMRGKIIVNVMLPPLNTEYKIVTFKIMPRRLNAHAIVNAGFLFQLSKNNVVLDARMVFGGLSPTFTRASQTEKYLRLKELFTNETLQSALKLLDHELIVTEQPPEPSIEYRRQTALALFYKALLILCPESIIDRRYRSGAIKLHDIRPVSQARQVFTTDPSQYPLTQPIPKLEGLYQCAGEAFYSDDLPHQPYEVFAAFTLTTEGSGDIVSIDPSYALSQDGVVAFYSAKDIPGENNFAPLDVYQYSVEEVFCSGPITYFNQPFGVIVAETQAIADRASKLVRVEYKNVKQPVIDVRDAIKDPNRLTLFRAVEATDKGNNVEKVIIGNTAIYQQYHFTMEIIACVTIPIEEGLRLYIGAHFLDAIHHVIARTLKIDQSRVDIYTRRAGGSYGIRVTRNIQCAVACSLVVLKLNRPCRLIQSLTSTTRYVGKRRPCAIDFKAGVSKDGVIQYMDNNLYHDEGCVVNELFVTNLLANTYYNCYDRSRWNTKVYNAITNTPKNTWCRAPGSLEGISYAELIMEQISYECSQDPIDVRIKNLDKANYQAFEQIYLTLKRKSSYYERRAAVTSFNNDNRWKKRGLRCSFFKWVVQPVGNFDTLLSVFQGDGTVIITHAGMEVGQGINTKAVQICAYYLKLPLEKIQVKGCNTTTCPNSYSGGGSIASQNVSVGVRICCEELLKRLEPIKSQMPNASWVEIIRAAYAANINLQTQYHITAADPARYPYDFHSAALAEVEIDVLTGESEILRVDILEDVGRSFSPEIDIGQIEGAFIMGVGYWTSERITYAKTGELLTDRTWNYYVPLCTDIPQDFRVYFKENSYSYDGILGAKVVGEPPLCLSMCVPLAIREAISEARSESSIPKHEWFNIDGPSSVDVISLLTATKTSQYKFN